VWQSFWWNDSHGLYILTFHSFFKKNVEIKLWHHKLISERLCGTQKKYLPLPQESYARKILIAFFSQSVEFNVLI
jgi:hypothetical protein